MPPRRAAAAASRRRSEGPDLFRGASPADDDDDMTQDEAMQVDSLLDSGQGSKSADLSSTSDSKEQPRSGRENVGDQEPQLEGEGINMPSAPGHGVADGSAVEEAEPLNHAISIENSSVDSPAGEEGGLAPTTATATSDDRSGKGRMDEERAAPSEISASFPKTDVSSLSETSAVADTGLLASLPVFFNKSLPSSSKLQIFQYPNLHRRRALPMPDSAKERGITPTIRHRPRSKRVEVELPLDQAPAKYDLEKGEEYAHGAAASETTASGSAPGRGTQQVKREHGGDASRANGRSTPKRRLEKMRLESMHIPHQTKYMIGVVRDGALHLTPVDSIHQLRPSMHYLDNLDMLEHKNRRNAAAADGDEENAEAADGAMPSRPRPAQRVQNLNVSMRATGDIAGGSGGGGGGGPGGSSNAMGNAKPLEGREALMAAEREAESEAWVDLEWKGQDSAEAEKAFDTQLFASSKARLECLTRPRDFLPSV